MSKEELTTLSMPQGTSHCSCLEHCFLFVLHSIRLTGNFVQPSARLLLLFAALPALVTPSCARGEFECSAPSDGCVPVARVFDGNVDCVTGGDDEDKDSRQMMAAKRFPNGEQINQRDAGEC